jgi:hypothetical protein
MRHGFGLYISHRINHLLQKPHPYPLDNFFHSFRLCGGNDSGSICGCAPTDPPTDVIPQERASAPEGPYETQTPVVRTRGGSALREARALPSTPSRATADVGFLARLSPRSE